MILLMVLVATRKCRLCPTKAGVQAAMCPGTELNRYDRFGSQDFKSCVSTSSTTGATLLVPISQGTNKKFHLDSRDGI